jgi:hypothetical protein
MPISVQFGAEVIRRGRDDRGRTLEIGRLVREMKSSHS